jgi:hypothetical protein
MTELNVKLALKDFEWVIRVLKSAQTKNQMDVVYNCFLSWEKKYTKEIVSNTELTIINRLRSIFWASFKNKNSKFVATSLI